MNIKHRGLIGWVVLWAALCAVTAGCTTRASSAASAAAPVVSSSFTQAQETALENELTTAFQAQLKAHPGHLLADADAALRQVFPAGDKDKIIANAAQHFTPAVASSSGPGSARDLWVKEVVTYAVTSGGVTLPSGMPDSSPATASPSAAAS